MRFSDSVTTFHLNDNASLVELQQAQLADQDRVLDALADSVGRTKSIALSISDELDSQAHLVNELDHKTDRTRNRMADATQAVTRVVRAARNDRTTQILCGLGFIVVIGIVLIIVLKTVV